MSYFHIYEAFVRFLIVTYLVMLMHAESANFAFAFLSYMS